ncbi:MAG: hypothetical protein ACLFPV_00400 [Spirochaetaceae bacterium]
MKTSQKIALSLLISVLVFGAFSVLAFSGLFDYIETTFFDPRVRQRFESRLSTAESVVERYHQATIQNVAAVLESSAIRRLVRTNQSREDILARQNLVGLLEAESAAFSSMRIFVDGGEQLIYSSEEEDIREQNAFRREYLPVAELPEGVVGLVPPEPPALPEVELIPEQNLVVYRLAFVDEFDTPQGTALFFFGTQGIENRLTREGVLLPSDRAVVVRNDALVLNGPQGQAETLRNAIGEGWAEITSSEFTFPTVLLEEAIRHVVFATAGAEGIWYLWLAPESAFQMTTGMRVILLASVILSSFLLVFLLLNVRQDPVLVVSERIKRFQINLLRHYFEAGEKVSWEAWQQEIANRREELTAEIKRGIGRLPKEREPEVDELISRSWDEIIGVIGSRARIETAPTDIARLESIVQQVVNNLQSLPQAGRPATEATTHTTGSRTPGPTSPEPVPEAEPLEEVSEEVSEIEEVEEIEEVPEAEELLEAEEVSEVEAVEELEEIAEVEEVVEAPEAEEPLEPVEAIDALLEIDAFEAEFAGIEEEWESGGTEDAEESFASVGDHKGVLERVEGLEEAGALPSESGIEEFEEAEEDEGAFLEPVDEALEMEPEETVGFLEEMDKPAPEEDEFEELTEEEEGAGEGELMPTTSGGGFLFGSTLFGFSPPSGEDESTLTDEGIEELSVADHDFSEDIEEMEEAETALLEAEEVEETSPSSRGNAVPVSPPRGTIDLQSLDLETSPHVDVMSLKELVLSHETGGNVIRDENGFYQIDSSAYLQHEEAKPGEMKRLVDSVTGRGDEEESGSGIDELLSSRVGLDLFPISDAGADQDSPDDKVREEGTYQSRMLLTEQGLDYDRFLAGYKQNESGVFKSLVTFTRIVKARAASIFLKKETTCVAAYTLGIDDACAAELRVPVDSFLYREILGKQKAILFRHPLHHYADFHGVCSDSLFSYIGRVVICPIRFRGEEAFLFLSAREGIESLESFFDVVGLQVKHTSLA